MSDRKDTRVTAGIGVVIDVDGNKVPCMTRNISRGGTFVLARQKLPEGRKVILDIIHDNVRLNTIAEVVTVTDSGVGLSFIEPSDEFKVGIGQLIDSLLVKQKNEPEAAPVEDGGAVNMAWSHLPDGKFWNFWRKRQRRVSLTSLSLDGAAVTCGSLPEVGEEVLIYLDHDTVDEQMHCRAEVVRITDNGFAVKFLTPRVEFRRAVSAIRKSWAGSEEPA